MQVNNDKRKHTYFIFDNFLHKNDTYFDMEGVLFGMFILTCILFNPLRVTRE